jgi:hypothetical protein
MQRIISLTLLFAVALSLSLAPASAQGRGAYVAPLSGGEEVPAVDTGARGQAVFKADRDGTSVDYRLIVANIQNVTMAHIHVAPAGANGPVVVWLYPDAPPPELIPGRSSGVLATGTITADDLVGQLAGSSVEDLLGLMDTGQTYVNVHTEAYPAGEVRGQIR